MIVALTYPITPSQLSLVNITTIGIPSLVLALEPNTSLVKGKFLRNVIFRAVPAGLTDFLMVVAAIVFSPLFGITDNELATMATIIIGAVGFMMLYRVSKPFDTIRKILIVSMLALFALGGLLFSWLFTLSPLSLTAIVMTSVIVLVAWPVMNGISWLLNRILKISKQKKADFLYAVIQLNSACYSNCFMII
jgi:cation-transporting ATPase E